MRVYQSRVTKTAKSLTRQNPSSCLEEQQQPRLRPFARTLMRTIVSTDGCWRTMVTRHGRRILTPVAHSRKGFQDNKRSQHGEKCVQLQRKPLFHRQES